MNSSNNNNMNHNDNTHTNRYYTSTMQWSECIPNTTTAVSSSSSIHPLNQNNMNQDENGGSVVAAVMQQQQQQAQLLPLLPLPHPLPPLQLPPLIQPLQPPLQQQQLLDTVSISPTCAAPTIKNHSVTHFGRYLYCFGGYDGRRNHTTLLVYDLVGHRWIRPIHYPNHHNNIHNTTTTTNTKTSTNSDGGMVDVSELGTDVSMHHPIDTTGTNNNTNGGGGGMYDHDHHFLPPADGNRNDHYDPTNGFLVPSNLSHHHHLFPTNLEHSDSIMIQGTPPPGRNGHSATLAVDDVHRDGAVNGRIVIIGGWLGTGPLAASDTHILEVRCHGTRLRWYQPTIYGTPPGPCNMHSADYVTHRKEVYVFRGGNGREYLNDLHALHVPTLTWRKVMTTGEIPQQRANHSSAILEETNELFIFGGWNGTERLNDIHILDTVTSTWTFPKIYGILPHPRAGMTLTALRGR